MACAVETAPVRSDWSSLALRCSTRRCALEISAVQREGSTASTARDASSTAELGLVADAVVGPLVVTASV